MYIQKHFALYRKDNHWCLFIFPPCWSFFFVSDQSSEMNASKTMKTTIEKNKSMPTILMFAPICYRRACLSCPQGSTWRKTDWDLSPVQRWQKFLSCFCCRECSFKNLTHRWLLVTGHILLISSHWSLCNILLSLFHPCFHSRTTLEHFWKRKSKSSSFLSKDRTLNGSVTVRFSYKNSDGTGKQKCYIQTTVLLSSFGWHIWCKNNIQSSEKQKL